MFKSVISVVKCVFITQMLCLVKNRHGPTTWGSDEKSRTMWTCLVPRGHHQSSVQEEQDGIFLHCDTLCDSEILSCDSGSTNWRTVGSYIVSFVVCNLASYGPELHAGVLPLPDASVNSYTKTGKSQRRVSLV